MSIFRHEHLRYAEDLVLFEQWLRFYFIKEEGGRLYLRMPANEMDKARALFPALIAVADALNNREIDHQTVMAVLHQSIMSGPCALSGAEWAGLLAGRDFRLTVQLLSFWVQAEEDALDAALLDFNDWRDRFGLWRKKPGVKDYAARVMQGGDIPTGLVQ